MRGGPHFQVRSARVVLPTSSGSRASACARECGAQSSETARQSAKISSAHRTLVPQSASCPQTSDSVLLLALQASVSAIRLAQSGASIALRSRSSRWLSARGSRTISGWGNPPLHCPGTRPILRPRRESRAVPSRSSSVQARSRGRMRSADAAPTGTRRSLSLLPKPVRLCRPLRVRLTIAYARYAGGRATA